MSLHSRARDNINETLCDLFGFSCVCGWVFTVHNVKMYFHCALFTAPRCRCIQVSMWSIIVDHMIVRRE